MKQEKIIGYKLKKEFAQYKRALLTIISVKDKENIFVELGSEAYKKIEQDGITHWFEAVYEEPKKIKFKSKGLKDFDEKIAKALNYKLKR